MKICYIVRRGAKSLCEDAALAGDTCITSGAGYLEAERPSWAGVADGVGGIPGGSLASDFLLSRMTDIRPGSCEELAEGMKALNRELVAYGESLGLGRMASALTCCYFTEQGCYMVHGGNTRLWRINGGYLRQLTEDHTTFRRLKKAGLDTAGCNRSEIYCCFGAGGGDMLGSLECREPFGEKAPESLLFTSDGIHDYVDEDAMEEILRRDLPLKDRLLELTEAALARGSSDDMTALVIGSLAGE
ncbi:MAG: serine/threonine-protein phosphatase [Abditibacteriota bacterium]|nr:serine/threonine-protein phosphatase [Abditibacteriota bacterium]